MCYVGLLLCPDPTAGVAGEIFAVSELLLYGDSLRKLEKYLNVQFAVGKLMTEAFLVFTAPRNRDVETCTSAS